LRPLLLLDCFAEGTNTGIKRVATANQRYGYDALLYVRKHYFSVEALRHATATVVNNILALRIRGCGARAMPVPPTAALRELAAESDDGVALAYKGSGVLVYWHVETNAVCLYSHGGTSCSEVAALIEGLIRHETELRVEKTLSTPGPGRGRVGVPATCWADPSHATPQAYSI